MVSKTLPSGFYVGVIVGLVAIGSLSLLPLWLRILRVWVTDPLRSIGAIFPLVACVGVLAAWRRLGWSMNGTYWAIPLIAASMLLGRIVSLSTLTIGTRTLLFAGPVLFLYGVGVALLFGGTRLLRASLAPLCLLLLVQPVPHAFNSLVDLPLQHLSASTARAFSNIIGLRPTGIQLRMMFAPDFGMMIVPGCNGVRGSITLGYLSLIFGYTRRLRPRMLILVSLLAFISGYILNLLRLCILVVYYRVGLSVPSLQRHGVGIDYAIGTTLFLFATLGIGLLIRSMKGVTAAFQKPDQKAWADIPSLAASSSPVGFPAVARALCFLVLSIAFIVTVNRSATSLLPLRPNEQNVLASFPAMVGPYRLTRRYSEHDSNGMIVLALADYSLKPLIDDTENRLTFGVWIGPENHQIAQCRFIQGKQTASAGSFDTIAPSSLAVHFVTSFYDDGISAQYDAESACSESGCSDHLARSRQAKLSIGLPSFSDLAFPPGRRLPILVRREWPNHVSTPSAQLQLQFESDVRLFIADLDLLTLVHRIGTQQ